MTRGGRYLLIAGHRRYVAAQRAGLREAPVTIVEATEEQRTARCYRVQSRAECTAWR